MRVSIRALILAATIVAAAVPSTFAQAGLMSADLGKNLEYLQTDNAGTTVPTGAANAFFFGRAFFSSGSFDGGSLNFNTTSLPFNSLASDCCGNTGGQYGTAFITKADMDAMFPTATDYRLDLTNSVTPALNTSLHILLPADLYTTTPNPVFSAASFNALNSLSAGQGLTLLTSTFTPDMHASGGQTFLTIFDLTAGGTIYSDFGTNLRDNWTIGSGLFLGGHDYLAQLIFDNYVSGSDMGVPTTARSDLRTDVRFSIPSVGVPEPATWAMMLAGFAMSGLLLRRTRKGAIAV